ncbi:MAG: hypothetical protein RLY86_2811 [Pseudomonadota bacterium]|jgi:hypothetical protein
MTTDAPPDTIIPTAFPELARLAWNRDPSCPISGAEAFALYERNWRHVDKNHLTMEEADLIRRLTDAHGHGHFLGR